MDSNDRIKAKVREARFRKKITSQQVSPRKQMTFSKTGSFAQLPSRTRNQGSSAKSITKLKSAGTSATGRNISVSAFGSKKVS